jgi:RimJ/RimL family protein N-acetyltransferase
MGQDENRRKAAVTPPVLISQLTPIDVAEYRRVRLRALEDHPEAFRSSRDEEAARPVSWWEARLAPRQVSGCSFFGAWTPARDLVGTAGLVFDARSKTLHTAKLVGMYVVPEHVGRGVAAQLLAACIAFARADPLLEILYLTVTSTNAGAIRLYARAGFRSYGCEPSSMKIGQRSFDNLMMSLALRPE